MTIIYWITTGLLALSYLAGGYFDITLHEEVVKASAKLGYPTYFFKILGFWKLAAGVSLLVPGLTRLKEWTYAGIFFNLTGATASHLFIKDPMDDVLPPVVILAIAAVSYALRPSSRRLPGSWL